MINIKDHTVPSDTPVLDEDWDSDTSSQHDSGFQDDDDVNHFLQLLLLQNQQMSQVMMKAVVLVAEAITAAATKVQPIPYHTSILTGPMWVLELLNGHPDRIRSELGVRKHIFRKLIEELSSHRYSHSKHVMLEEQLSIFLYMCVTDLSCKHVGEHFQRSNDTISKYAHFFPCFAPR